MISLPLLAEEPTLNLSPDSTTQVFYEDLFVPTTTYLLLAFLGVSVLLVFILPLSYKLEILLDLRVASYLLFFFSFIILIVLFIIR